MRGFSPRSGWGALQEGLQSVSNSMGGMADRQAWDNAQQAMQQGVMTPQQMMDIARKTTNPAQMLQGLDALTGLQRQQEIRAAGRDVVKAYEANNGTLPPDVLAQIGQKYPNLGPAGLGQVIKIAANAGALRPMQTPMGQTVTAGDYPDAVKSETDWLKAVQPDLSEKEKEILRYKKVFGLDDQDSIALAENQVEVTQDELGRPLLVNKITNEGKNISRRQARNIKREQQKQNQDQPFMTPEIAKEGTGVISNLKQFWNNAVGWMKEGVPFENTAEARNKLKTFNHNAIQALVINPRAPVAEQRTIKGFLPDPDKFFKDPDEAKKQVENLKNFLKTQKKNKLKAIQSGNLSADQHKTYTDQVNNIDVVLDFMPENQSGFTGNFSEMPENEFLSVNPQNLSDEQLETYEQELMRRTNGLQ